MTDEETARMTLYPTSTRTVAAALLSYNDRENARADRMRRYLRSCRECATPIFEEPGYCVECAFFGVPER